MLARKVNDAIEEKVVTATSAIGTGNTVSNMSANCPTSLKENEC